MIDAIGAGPVGVDTPVFAYLIEEHPSYLKAVSSLFAAIDRGRLSAVTSSLTLLEVLVLPLRNGDLRLAEKYDSLLNESGGVRLVPIDAEQILGAARLRAEWPALRTPDALQLAAALLAGCSAFLTNDRRLPSIPGLRVLQLKEFAA